MSVTISKYTVLKEGEGLRLQSGPGRDLIFKVTGEDTNGALDYFIVDVHHVQEETIHVLKGRFKIRIGDEMFTCDEGGFAYLPSKAPHAFLNLTDEPGEIIVVYTPGGGHKFYVLGGLSTTPSCYDHAAVIRAISLPRRIPRDNRRFAWSHDRCTLQLVPPLDG